MNGLLGAIGTVVVSLQVADFTERLWQGKPEFPHRWFTVRDPEENFDVHI